MKRYLPFLFSSFFCISSLHVWAQTASRQDSVVQLYGVVMSSDSLKALDAASVIVEGSGRGTISNYDGVFSIVVLKGDTIRFSSVGFKDQKKVIPKDFKGDQYSAIVLMTNDTAYLPTVILKPRPSRSQFERDFVNTDVPADQLEIARQNNSEATRRALMASLPADGREAVSANFRQQAQKYYYAGQVPPQNIFNPVAWSEFIKAWKRGDFKRKTYD